MVLKACPFCGSKNTMYVTTELFVTVLCKNCMASGPAGETEDKATNKWNNPSILVKCKKCGCGETCTIKRC